MKWILILLTVEAFVLCHGAVPTITQAPQNATVLEGSSVNLTCGVTVDNSTRTFAWQISRSLSSTPYIYSKIIPYGDATFPTNSPLDLSRFRALSTFGLVISNLSQTDGSQYMCGFPFDSVSSSAFVVVTAIPQISIPSIMNVGATSNLTCNVTFGSAGKSQLMASQIPVLNMSIGSQVVNDAIAPPVTTYVTYYDNQIVYTVSKTLNYTAVAGDSGSLITCKASTSNPSFTTYSSAGLNITVAAQIVQFPNQTNFNVGEVISCLTSGFPIPVVTWTAVKTPSSTSTSAGSNFTISNDMIGYNVWNCSASNGWGTDSRLVNFTVSAPPITGAISSSNQNLAVGLGVGLGVGIPLLILIIVVIVVCCCLRRKRREKEKPTAASHAQTTQPPVYTAQYINSEPGPPEYKPASLYAAINSHVIRNESSEVDISGFGALNVVSPIGSRVASPIIPDNDISRESRPRRSRSEQTTPQPMMAHSDVDEMPDEMDGHVNLSYTGNDDINGNYRPNEVVLERGYGKMDWPDSQRVEPRRFDTGSPANKTLTGPVPRPRQNMGSNQGLDETYPNAGRTYLYTSPDASGSRGTLQPSVYFDAAAADLALRFGSPAPDKYVNIPYHGSNDRLSPFSPVAAAHGDSYESADLHAVGNRALDAGTSRDSSYRSNQLLHVLGASKSIDV